MIPTSTPAPVPLTEIQQFTEFGRQFSEMGIAIGFLFVVALLIIAFIVHTVVNRNRTPATEIYKQVIAHEQSQLLKAEKDVDEAEARAEKASQQFIETLTYIGEGQHRIADSYDGVKQILERMEKAGGEQNVDMTAMRLALQTLVSTGSEPLRALAKEVFQILGIVQEIKGHTANWEEVLKAVPDIRIAIYAVHQHLGIVEIDAAQEKRRATQPIPAVDPAEVKE